MLNVIKGICGFIALLCALAIATEAFKLVVTCVIFAGIYAIIDIKQRINKGELL